MVNSTNQKLKMEYIRWALLLTMFCCSLSTTSSNILMFPSAYGMNSHFRDFIKMSELLLQNGHNMTVLINDLDVVHMTYLQRDASLKGTVHFMTFPYPEGTIRIDDEDFAVKMHQRSALNLVSVAQSMFAMQIDVCDAIYMNASLMQNITDAKFDLIATDMVDLCARALSSILDVPVLAHSCQTAFDTVYYPQTPSLFPSDMAFAKYEYTFMERAQNLLATGFMETLFGTYMLYALQSWADSRGITPHKPFSHAYSDAIILLDYDYTLGYPRAFLPNVIPIGGWDMNEPKPLTGNLRSFVEDPANDGTVLVAFGSSIADVDNERTRAFVRVFEKFPNMRFIWKYTRETEELPDNVLQMKWLPQSDLLAHPTTRVFITHCGIHSAYETVLHGVPVVAMPFASDQPKNAQRLIYRLGMGEYVNVHDFDEKTFENALRSVIEDEQYMKNAKAASLAFHDQQTTPKDRLLYYFDYAIRNRGAGRLATDALQHLNVVQLYSLDVFACIFVVFSVACLVSSYVLYLVMRRVVSKVSLQKWMSLIPVPKEKTL